MNMCSGNLIRRVTRVIGMIPGHGVSLSARSEVFFGLFTFNDFVAAFCFALSADIMSQ